MKPSKTQKKPVKPSKSIYLSSTKRRAKPSAAKLVEPTKTMRNPVKMNKKQQQSTEVKFKKKPNILVLELEEQEPIYLSSTERRPKPIKTK